jgi:REP-associated tyrosine transposase
MVRRLRIQYADAIYHVMARGNGRQDIVGDDADRQRLIAGLEKAVLRSGWVLYAFVLMTNHLHLVLKTPRANLAKGMQVFLSGYANWWGRRHRFGGHLFQGRYRTELVEDETYLWVLTRYVHLNPVRAGIVQRPEQWPWSSYRGYADRRHRFDWVAHEQLLAAWSGEFGRTDALASYRRFVAAGINDPPPAPWTEARHNWILGSDRFVDRLRVVVQGHAPRDLRREERVLRGVDLERVVQTVCRHYGVDRSELACRGSRGSARAALAYLARQHTEVTLAELVPVLGLSRPESVPNLTKKFSGLLQRQPQARQELKRLERELGLCNN